MAYSDIQEKLGQQRMANSVLLAEKYSQGNLFPKGSEGNPYSKNPRAQSAKRKRDYKKAQEEKKKLPSDADIQTKGNMQGQATPEEVFGEDYEGGPTYLNSKNLNRLLQIGGTAGSMIPFMGGNLLKMLIGGPKVMAGTPNFPGGGYSSTSGAFVDLSGEAYFLIDGELIPQGGYDPAKHGDLIPHGGPDIPQAMNNKINPMMIATHDKPLFKTPPATGAAADNLANDLLIRAVTGGLIKPATPKNPLG